MAELVPAALRAIRERIARVKVDAETNFYFVCGMPISDIGKGTFVAHLLSLLPDSDALKFDGLLNTNANGRHTRVGHDDFGIYEKVNPDKSFGDERYLLGGYLFQEFIQAYGEFENLCFRPHFSLFMVAKILEKWAEIGKPANLIVEIGGTLADFEVEPYIPPLIQHFKQRFGERSHNILLSELGWNGEYVKTRTVQKAVEEHAKRFCAPDVILAREPKHMPHSTSDERRKNEDKLREQLLHRLGFAVPPENVICVPFYEPQVLSSLGDFYAVRCGRVFHAKPVVCLGSRNPGKVRDWKSYLGDDMYCVTPDALRLDLEVPEGRVSLRENAEKKAVAWAQASGCPAVSDDTGFYIDRLGGRPGVSVKTWGGQFERELSSGEFMRHLGQVLRGVSDTSASFETAVAVATPAGNVVSQTFTTPGRIDKSKLGNAAEQGFPLSSVFVADGRTETWAGMSAAQRRDWDADMIDWVKSAVERVAAEGDLPRFQVVRAA